MLIAAQKDIEGARKRDRSMLSLGQLDAQALRHECQRLEPQKEISFFGVVQEGLCRVVFRLRRPGLERVHKLLDRLVCGASAAAVESDDG